MKSEQSFGSQVELPAQERWIAKNGVRYGKDVPEEKIATIEKAFDAYDEEVLRTKKEDPRCYVDHALIAGSAPIVRKPLTPYGLLSGAATRDVVLAKRAEKKKNQFRDYVDIEDFDGDATVLSRPDTLLPGIEFLESSKADFQKFITEHAGEPTGKIGLLFAQMELRSESDVLELPILQAVAFKERVVELPPNLLNKIRVSEIAVFPAWGRDALRTTIDQDGWKIENAPAKEV